MIGVVGGRTPIVLVHGVGFGPETLAPLARTLVAKAQVMCIARRGYGTRADQAPPASVADHVDDVIAALDRAGVDRAVIAGMSGGATIALALALSRPERVVTAVAHEPAVGSLAPELRALVRGALDRGGGPALLRALAGEATWSALGSSATSSLDASAALVEADAAAFLAFEPQLPAALVDAPLMCSVGERSSRLRFTVAQRLAARTGAAVVTVPGCGHLPQFDAPAAFGRLILDQTPVTA